jgi:hypothetical protein
MKNSTAIALACLISCIAAAHIVAQPASGISRPGLPDRLPIPGYNRPPPPSTGPAPHTVTNTPTSSATNQLTFGKLPLNQTFFFLSDTNKTYPWVKIGTVIGQNTVNSNKARISAETLVKQ